MYENGTKYRKGTGYDIVNYIILKESNWNDMVLHLIAGVVPLSHYIRRIIFKNIKYKNKSSSTKIPSPKKHNIRHLFFYNHRIQCPLTYKNRLTRMNHLFQKNQTFQKNHIVQKNPYVIKNEKNYLNLLKIIMLLIPVLKKTMMFKTLSLRNYNIRDGKLIKIVMMIIHR